MLQLDRISIILQFTMIVVDQGVPRLFGKSLTSRDRFFCVQERPLTGQFNLSQCSEWIKQGSVSAEENKIECLQHIVTPRCHGDSSFAKV